MNLKQRLQNLKNGGDATEPEKKPEPEAKPEESKAPRTSPQGGQMFQCSCGSHIKGECPECDGNGADSSADSSDADIQARLDAIGGEKAVNPPGEAGETKTEPEAPPEKKDGLEPCPYCAKAFKHLSRHKCKMKPAATPPEEPKTEEPKDEWMFSPGNVVTTDLELRVLELKGADDNRQYKVMLNMDGEPRQFLMSEAELLSCGEKVSPTGEQVGDVRVEYELDPNAPNISALLKAVGEAVAKENVRLLEFLEEKLPLMTSLPLDVKNCEVSVGGEKPAEPEIEKGFILFIDCLFSERLIQPVTTFEQMIKPLGDAVARENSVPHWSTVDYGKGPGLLTSKLERLLQAERPTGAVVVDSSTAEARACLPVLKMYSDHVVFGIR